MTALATPRVDLLASLEQHNATFTKLLSLIPARFYLPPDQDELDSRWMKNKKRRTGEEIKEHKRKAKADKLDPANNLTTDQILARQAASAAPAESAAGPSTSPAAANGLPPVQQITPLPPAASITDLRAKLHDRLEKFKRDRGEPETRDELEAERRQKRGEMRDRRRKERKEQRRKAKAEPTAKPAKQQLIVPETSKKVDTDGVSYQAMSLPSSSKQGKAPLKALSNPSQALAHLEKHNAKLAGMSEEKRKEVEERERWAKAEERARGGKVADEEKTLKKAVKRMEKTKSKSGKEWNERKRDLEKSQATAIKKRNDNIAMRAQSRRDKKTGVKDKGKKQAGGAKKFKKRPGFEGGKGRKEKA